MDFGFIQVFTRTGGSAPVFNVAINISTENDQYITSYTTDNNGFSAPVQVETPPRELSLDETNTQKPYASYNVSAFLSGFLPIDLRGVQVFSGETSLLELMLIPTSPEAPAPINAGETIIPPHILYDTRVEGRSRGPLTNCPGWVLSEVVIPTKVTVHLGKPSANAKNVTVSFKDYIKNVASSEIYPTWPVESLKANIYAQISLTLNRIFTEWYKSRGYNYTITNSTSYDQYFVPNRNIFENISKLVDDIFNTYIRKQGTINPYYAEYCDGKTVTCKGMKQWGTVTYANQGLSALNILRKYYTNIELVTTNNIKSIPESYPGRPLTIGSTGADVRTIQRQLNRIAKDYPFFGTQNVDGVFDQETQTIVKRFQKQFSLTQDGVVGKSTWYKISYIYVSVKDLAELTSEGEKPNGDTQKPVEGVWPGTVYRIGSRGEDVERIQFYLNAVGKYQTTIPQIVVDGIFGAGTDAAVRAFQAFAKLSVDGIVGKDTWNALYKEYSSIQDDENTDQPFPGGYPGQSFQQGSRGNYVQTIQFWLKIISNHYSSIPKIDADGIFGPATSNAVRSFQNFFALAVDGIVGKQTWQKINEVYIDVLAKLLPANQRPGVYPGTPLTVGSTGQSVKELQFYLNILSAYYTTITPVAYDGTFGSATRNAVIAFQRLFTLPSDGVVGPITWIKIYETFLTLRNVDGPVYKTKQVPYPGAPVGIGADGTVVDWIQFLIVFISTYYIEVQPIDTTGFYDEETESAVRSFQREFGLPITGTVDQITFNQMVFTYYSLLAQIQYPNGEQPDGAYPGYALTIGSAGPAVWELQFFMNEIASRYCVAAFVPNDGYFDEQTFQAVLDFQDGFGLPATGLVDQVTWDTIYEFYISE